MFVKNAKFQTAREIESTATLTWIVSNHSWVIRNLKIEKWWTRKDFLQYKQSRVRLNGRNRLVRYRSSFHGQNGAFFTLLCHFQYLVHEVGSADQQNGGLLNFCRDKCNYHSKPFVHFFAKFWSDTVGLFCWPQASIIGEVDNCVAVLWCDDTFFTGTCFIWIVWRPALSPESRNLSKVNFIVYCTFCISHSQAWASGCDGDKSTWR